MKTTEIYETVMHAVTEVTGIERESLLHSNMEESTDARYLLVKALSKALTDGEIARLMGRSRRGIAYLRQGDWRMNKWLVRKNSEEIEKTLGKDFFSRE